MKTKEIYSRKMAMYLRNKGFELVDMGVNPNRPDFSTFIFEDSPELRKEMFEYSAMLNK